MADFLGISLGKEELAIATVSRSGRETAIQHFQRLEYDGEDRDISARAAFAAAKAAAYAGTAIAISLPGEDVFLQPQTVAFVKRAHIARTLPFEMEQKLPFDVSKGVLDFAVVGREGAGSRILVTAVRREFLEAVIEPFAARGLKVRMVTTDVLSAPALGAFMGPDSYTALYVSRSGWKLALCEKGRLLFARAAPAGPTAGGAEKALAAWFRQSFMAAPERLSRSPILLCGAAGAVDCQALSNELSLPVERLTLPASSLADSVGADRAQEAFLASAAICAAAELSTGGGEIDLLAAARGREGILESLFAPLAAALVLVTLLFGVQAWRYSGQRQRALAERGMAEAQAREIWDELFPGEQPPGGVHAGLVAAVNEIEQNSGSRVLGGDVAWLLKALHALSAAVPEGSKPTFAKFDAKPGELKIEVSSNETASAERIAKAITEGGVFQAEYRDMVTDERDRTTFSIVMKPVGGEDAG